MGNGNGNKMHRDAGNGVRVRPESLRKVRSRVMGDTLSSPVRKGVGTAKVADA